MSFLGFTNRKKYTLYGKYGVQVIPDPRGWQDDEKELIRSDKYFGVMSSLTNNLEFYGAGFTYLRNAYKADGILAEVRLESEERNSDTDEWEITYVGYFDFSQYKQSKNFVRIKFDESKFYKNIESRLRDKYELDRLTDLKGNVIPALQYKKMTLKGRDIFRETLFQNRYKDGYQPGTGADDEKTVKVIYKGSDTFDALVDFCIPLNLIYRSDESAFAPATYIDTNGYLNLFTAQISRDFSGVIYNAGNVWYLKAEKAKTVTVTLKIKVRAKYYTPGSNSATFRIYNDTVRVNDDNDMHSLVSTELINVSSTNVYPSPNTITENQWKEFEINHTQTFDLLKDDSLGLRVEPFFGGSYSDSNTWQFEFSPVELLEQEYDAGDLTECECLSIYDVCERLFLIITGKNTFQSTLLLNFWRDLLVTNGFKIRKIPGKTISISLDDVLDSLNTISDIALIISGEMVRIELKKEVFLNSVSVSLGRVSNINREIDEKTHFSSVEIGYDFNGQYEEVNGLDEYNIKNTYTTCIDTIENKHSAISKIRADGYGITLAQAKQYLDYPKLDTKYDKENFFIDCKLVGGVYLQRFWADDFDNLPTGVFSPETAFNLRLSPANCFFRKGKYLSTGLQKFPTKRLKYSATEGNSNLTTDVAERFDIPNNALPIPYFLPENVSFQKKIKMSDFRHIVLNPYKLIKFVNEFGEDEYGFIYPSVKPNKEGDFKLIQANI